MILRKEKLEDLRKELIARRAIVAQDIRQKTTELLNDDEVYTDTVDQASSEMDKTFLAQMKHRESGILFQIDEALLRFGRGTYGECQDCGEPIAEARITAFPFTLLCVDCKTEQESEDSRFSNRVL